MSPDQCPIAIDRSNVAGGIGFGADDIVDTDDEDAYICGKCVPSPNEPSPDMVARHNLTHLPYQSWCPHCVAARKNNEGHRSGSSASRSLPLLVLDYCFIRESSSPDPLTVLVGRLYPSRALFATVCEHKGAHDSHTVNRLCQFLKNSGVTQFVYKTDQENAVIAVVREALKVSQTPGSIFHV